RLNKTETFLLVEPFNGTGCLLFLHDKFPFSAKFKYACPHNCGKRAYVRCLKNCSLINFLRKDKFCNLRSCYRQTCQKLWIKKEQSSSNDPLSMTGLI